MARPRRLIPGFVKTKRELAAAVGISHTYLYEMFKRKGCPTETDKGWSVSDMVKFAKVQMVSQMDKGGMSDAVAARLRLMVAQISKIELQNDKARGKYLDREDWKKEFGGLVAEMDAAFSRLFLQELPLRFEGMQSIDIRDTLKRSYDKVRNEFFEKGMAIKPKEER